MATSTDLLIISQSLSLRDRILSTIYPQSYCYFGILCDILRHLGRFTWNVYARTCEG